MSLRKYSLRHAFFLLWLAPSGAQGNTGRQGLGRGAVIARGFIFQMLLMAIQPHVDVSWTRTYVIPHQWVNRNRAVQREVTSEQVETVKREAELLARLAVNWAHSPRVSQRRGGRRPAVLPRGVTSAGAPWSWWGDVGGRGDREPLEPQHHLPHVWTSEKDF